ncbi:unnamed protein product, partial [Rotaria magnacalcarata]
MLASKSGVDSSSSSSLPFAFETFSIISRRDRGQHLNKESAPGIMAKIG